MATQPTPAELRAKADQEERDAATAREQEQQQRQTGMLSWLWNNVGSIFEIGAVLLGAFLFARSGWGSKMLDGLVNMLPDSWQFAAAGLLNKFLGLDVDMGKSLEKMDYATFHDTLKDQASPEVLDILYPNNSNGNKTLRGFFNIVRTANSDTGKPEDGKVTLNTLTSSKTIVALIKQNAPMAKALMLAVMKPGTGGEPSETAQKMKASIKAIIAGPELNDLLSGTNRTNTIEILAAALPADVPVSKDGLNTIIDTGIKTGKIDALRQLFTDAVDGTKHSDTTLNDVTKIVGLTNMVNLIDVNKVKGEAAKYVVATLQDPHHPQAKIKQDELIQALGETQGSLFLSALKNGENGTKFAQLLLTKENVQALPQALALLDQLPELTNKLPRINDQPDALTQARKFLTPEHIKVIQKMVMVNGVTDPLALKDAFLDSKTGAFSMEHTIDSLLLNPNTRPALRTAGLDNIVALVKDQNPLLTQRNLDAALTFCGKLDNGKPSANTMAVMHHLGRMFGPNPLPMSQALKGLTGAQLAMFFSSPANKAAFAGLLDKNTGIVGNTPAMQAEIKLLRADFDKGPGVGLGAILGEEASAQFLLDHANDKAFTIPKSVDYQFVRNTVAVAEEAAERGAMQMQVLWHHSKTLGNTQNQDIVLELGRMLNGTANVQTAAAAPAPAPGKRTQVTQSH